MDEDAQKKSAETTTNAVPQPASPSPSQSPTEPQPADAPTPTVAAPADDAHTTQWQHTPAPSITWTASEFISHQKSPGWYAALLGGTVVFAALVWVLTKDLISAGVIVFAGVMFGVYATRKPRQVTYTLTAEGVEIDGRQHRFNEYRSFSLQSEGAFSSITLTPHKRFGFITSIYYDPADEDKIIDILGYRVPHEERDPDLVDQLMRRMRF